MNKRNFKIQIKNSKEGTPVNNIFQTFFKNPNNAQLHQMVSPIEALEEQQTNDFYDVETEEDLFTGFT